jgi:alcohol dehydrogenase class IV
MSAFRFNAAALPAAILAGPGCRRDVAIEADALGLRRVLLLCGPNLRRATGIVDEIAADLGGCLAGIFGEVAAHAPAAMLAEAAARARDLAADAVLSVGGGAVHDTAKAVALMAPSGSGIADFLLHVERDGVVHPPQAAVAPLPLFTVPSTFSAADVVAGGAVTLEGGGGKRIFGHPGLAPRRVFLDGEVVATTPRAVLAASGLNALHHCLEAHYSRVHQPITDALALAALAALLRHLPVLAADRPAPDAAACQPLIEAAAMSGLSYINSGLGIGHAVCHSLGGRYGLSHGAANAVMIPHSIRFNLDAAADRLAAAARAVGAAAADAADGAAAAAMLAAVDALAERLDTPRTLRDIGLPDGQIERIAEDVMGDPGAGSNPRPASFGEVVALLRAAW